MAYLADSGADGVGGKARSLARLAHCGCATPRAFVVTDEVFRALRAGGPPVPERWEESALPLLDAGAAALLAAPWPDGFEQELGLRLEDLGATHFSVRSSFAAEDSPTDTAAGVYASVLDVPSVAVLDAIRSVLCSALAPGAVAYALARGLRPAANPVAVLIHPFVRGDACGSAAYDPGDALVVSVSRGAITAETKETLAATMRRLSAEYGPVEVEWVISHSALTFLQMRPYVAAPPPRSWSGFSGSAPLGWRWDAAHNPLPLSPAQAGLVEAADTACRIGYRQAVLGGYLFRAGPGGDRGGDSDAPLRVVDPADVQDAFAALEAEVSRRLGELGDAPALEDALGLFLSVYEPLFGVIQPAARRGREALLDLARRHGMEPMVPALLSVVESRASERLRLRQTGSPQDYLAVFGDEALVWDVAQPTLRDMYRDRDRHRDRHDDRHDSFLSWHKKQVPAPLARLSPLSSTRPWQRAAHELRCVLPAPARAAFEDTLAVARTCMAVGENDDWLYARVQAVVRRALLRLGKQLVAAQVLDAPDDVFFWTLSVARQADRGQPPPEGRGLARAGRLAYETALADPPPAEMATARAPRGAPHDRSPATLFWGAGTSGRVLGRVHLHDPRAPGLAPEDAVLVARTLLPTELPLLRAAALVTETGGPLDHVAAQARERGLPAVVGATGACAALAPGDLVLVDADRGCVVLLGR
jgi:pyruvate,water dikinase